MAKVDKRKMSDELNEILGLCVDWTKLTASDLQSVFDLVKGGLVDAGLKVGIARAESKAKGIASQLIELGAEKLRERLGSKG